MPPKSKTSRQDILNAAFLIAKEEGINEINARSVAKRLNCSTQPIFRVYNNMEELKIDLIEKIYAYYRQFTDQYIDEQDELYRVSYAYVEFARKEKKLFEAVYVSDIGGRKLLSQIVGASFNQNIIKKTIKQYNVSEEKANQIFRDVRFYTHGVATYVLVDSIHLSEQEVSNLLKIAIQRFKND